MRKLIPGIVDFRERLLSQYAARFREVASGQNPDALFVTCANSRVVPDLLVSTDPGDLFVIRNVGNLIPPATVEANSTGDLSEASAIEYAVVVLKVRDVVVCGHSDCGAMKAALARKQVLEVPNLNKWLYHANTAVFPLGREGPLNASQPARPALATQRPRRTRYLTPYPIVRERVAAGTLRLNAWWFDIASGNMFAYEHVTPSFEVIDRQEADRLLARLDAAKATKKGDLL